MATATSSPSHQPSSAKFTTLAIKSASSLMLLQVFTRAATFGLNQALVRLVSPEVFGTATIQFELLLSTILFLSREGVRNTMLRAPMPLPSKGSSGKAQTPSETNSSTAAGATNVSLLPIFLGIPVALLASTLYVYTSDPSTVRSQPRFDLAVALYTLAAVLELLSEPLQIRAQNELKFGTRVRAEGTGVVLKSVMTVAVLVVCGPRWALPAFAAGQMLYGTSVLVTYIWEYRGVLTQNLWVPRASGSLKMDQTLLRLSMAMTGQSVVKHFLTEGDKLVISRISTLEDQGGYAVASNYGSLVARIVFQPIEETSRLFFSKTLISSKAAPATRTKAKDKTEPEFPTGPDSDSLELASTVLHTILLFHAHLALILLTFGPPYIPTLLSIILPGRYQRTSAPRILKTYCTSYLPTMAFNGVLEAFISSAATSSDLARQSKWMVIFSVAFILATYLFVETLGWKETGLVWANVVNLGMRALYGWVFVGSYFGKHGRSDLVGVGKFLPPLSVLSTFLASGLVVRWAKPLVTQSWQDAANHIGIGISCLLACFAMCYSQEHEAFYRTAQVLRKKVPTKES